MLTVNKLKHIVLGFIILFHSFSIHAADEMMHFYGDIIVGLSADIPIPDAIQYALGNVMVDSGIYTHPMGLTVARLLNHFQGTPITIKTDGGFIKNGVALASIENPLLFQLLDEGMKTGNKAMIGAVRHRLMDLFYHSGWSSLFGHMEGGHRPDMPHVELYKAQRCFQAIMELTFYLRDMAAGPMVTTTMERILGLLGESKIKELYKISGTQNMKDLVQYMRKKPGLYALLVWEIPEIKYAYSIRIENANQYHDLAFEELFKDMKQNGILDLETKEFLAIKSLFQDIRDRNDLSPQDAFRIAMYRLFQALSNTKTEQSSQINLSPEITNKLHLEKLIGLDSQKGFLADLSLRAVNNETELRLLKTDIQELKNSLGGEWKKTSAMSLKQVADLDIILGKFISWDRIIDHQTGLPLQIEDGRVGDIPDLRDIESYAKEYNRSPEYLESFYNMLSKLTDGAIQHLSRLKAVAEVATFAIVELTKDTIPNSRESSLQHVNFENDSLPHACWTQACRIQAVRNALGKIFGINVELSNIGSLGFFKFIKEKIKLFKLKLPSRKNRVMREEQIKLEQYMREYLLEMGYATQVPDGRILTFLEMNDGQLTKVKPNFTAKGYREWWRWSGSEFWTLFFRLDLFGQYRSKKIIARIESGSEVKTKVRQIMNHWYGSGTEVPSQWLREYPLFKTSTIESLNQERKIRLTPKGHKVYLGLVCSQIFRSAVKK